MSHHQSRRQGGRSSVISYMPRHRERPFEGHNLSEYKQTLGGIERSFVDFIECRDELVTTAGMARNELMAHGSLNESSAKLLKDVDRLIRIAGEGFRTGLTTARADELENAVRQYRTAISDGETESLSHRSISAGAVGRERRESERRIRVQIELPDPIGGITSVGTAECADLQDGFLRVDAIAVDAILSRVMIERIAERVGAVDKLRSELETASVWSDQLRLRLNYDSADVSSSIRIPASMRNGRIAPIELSEALFGHVTLSRRSVTTVDVSTRPNTVAITIR